MFCTILFYFVRYPCAYPVAIKQHHTVPYNSMLQHSIQEWVSACAQPSRVEIVGQ